MRKYPGSGKRWIWIYALVLAGLLALGFFILPEVFARGYAAPRTPAGLFALSLVTLLMFLGLLVSLAVGHLERLMIILFVAFRIGEVAWQYQLGRHSLWYLAGFILAHLLVGGLALVFISEDHARNHPA
jgi:hypothetical protein